MTVTCESELTAVEGRKLVFKVSLHDEKGPVGGGVHERFIINNAKFAAKAESKKGVTASPSQSAPLALPAPPKGEPLALMGRLAVHIQRLSVLFHHLRFRLLLGGGQQADGLFVGAEQLKIQRFIIRRGGGPLSVCNRDSLPRAGTKNQVRNHL